MATMTFQKDATDHQRCYRLSTESKFGYIGKRVHGQADTDTRTRTLMEKTGSYGKDGQLWKRRALMEKTDSYGKDGQLWKRRTVMEKTGSYGKDGHLWKRRTLMEKTDTKHLKPIF